MNRCYLCGATLRKGKNMTRDHVPPQSIFPSDKPQNLITVPCCLSCNQEFKQLDQKMRNHIAALAGEASADVGRVARNDILRSFRHSMQFIAQTKPHPTLEDDQGTPRQLFFFDERELTTWIGRIVRGLIFKRSGRILDPGIALEVKALPEIRPQPSDTFPMEEGLQFRPYFVYGEVKEENTSMWILIFYDHLAFAATLPSCATP